MAKIIKPKVSIIDYGPKSNDEMMVSPDEFIYGAAGITYKDTGALTELIELKKNDEDIKDKIKKSLIKSAGAGHASMATTPGLWVFLEGDCSKLVDSLFTGSRFSSSLMPSGRRIPVTKDQIVIPKKISEDSNAQEIYTKSIEDCIKVYEELQERGVQKQEANKIVPYGHRGGGLIFMPLETIISYSNEFKDNPSIPLEGREIISQLEDFMHSHEMDIIYESRKSAPRTGCTNPNVFHNRKNLAGEIMKIKKFEGIYFPEILSFNNIPSEERDKRIKNFLDKREEIFRQPERIIEEWPMLLRNIDEIINDYNNSLGITTISNSSWRVWGEVKRHRTLPQTVESVYHAVERAIEIKENMPTETDNKISRENWSRVVSIPSSVKKQENFNLWVNTFRNSLEAYEKLKKRGILESDAISLIPRGIKLGIVKQFDFYNLTTGYISLRLCHTAEPEMRETTEVEAQLAKSIFGSPIDELISPKCAYVGFCPDRYCGEVNKYVSDYNKDIHMQIQNARELEILEKLD